MVPVYCPPWPGSLTILPIFNPSALMSERSPLEVGLASWTLISALLVKDLRFFLLRLLCSEMLGSEALQSEMPRSEVAGPNFVCSAVLDAGVADLVTGVTSGCRSAGCRATTFGSSPSSSASTIFFVGPDVDAD